MSEYKLLIANLFLTNLKIICTGHFLDTRFLKNVYLALIQ